MIDHFHLTNKEIELRQMGLLAKDSITNLVVESDLSSDLYDSSVLSLSTLPSCTCYLKVIEKDLVCFLKSNLLKHRI